MTPGRPLTCTYWPNLTATNGRTFTSTLAQLAERFRGPRTVASKAALPGWAPTAFRGSRCLQNVAQVDALGFDVDGGLSFEDGLRVAADHRALVHTTFNHRAEAPRLRIILEASRPMTVDEHRRLWTWLAAGLSAQGATVDPKAKDASRLWFLPGIPPGGEYAVGTTDGTVLDVDAALGGLAPEVAKPPVPARRPTEPCTTDRVRRARAYLAKREPAISGQGGHARTFRTAAALVRGFELPEDVAFDLLWHEYNPRCEEPWSEYELRRKVREAAEKSDMPHGEILRRSA